MKTEPALPSPCRCCGSGRQKARLLTVGGRMQNLARNIREVLGIEVVPIDFKELAGALNLWFVEEA